MSIGDPASNSSKVAKRIRLLELVVLTLLITVAVGLLVLSLYCFITDASGFTETVGRVVHREKIPSSEGGRFMYTTSFDVQGRQFQLKRVAYGFAPVGGSVRIYFDPDDPEGSIYAKSKVFNWVLGVSALATALFLAGCCPFVPKLILYFTSWKHARIAENWELMPETQLDSLPHDGLVKVRGRIASADEVKTSPISRKKCVYYQVLVSKTSHRQHGSHIVRCVVDDEWRAARLHIEDETGKAIVDLKNAEVNFNADTAQSVDDAPPQTKEILQKRYHIDTGSRFFGSGMAFTESVIFPDDDVQVLGCVEQQREGPPRLTSGKDTLVVSDWTQEKLQKHYFYQAVRGPTTISCVIVTIVAGLLWFGFQMARYTDRPSIEEAKAANESFE